MFSSPHTPESISNKSQLDSGDSFRKPSLSMSNLQVYVKVMDSMAEEINDLKTTSISQTLMSFVNRLLTDPQANAIYEICERHYAHVNFADDFDLSNILKWNDDAFFKYKLNSEYERCLLRLFLLIRHWNDTSLSASPFLVDTCRKLVWLTRDLKAKWNPEWKYYDQYCHIYALISSQLGPLLNQLILDPESLILMNQSMKDRKYKGKFYQQMYPNYYFVVYLNYDKSQSELSSGKLYSFLESQLRPLKFDSSETQSSPSLILCRMCEDLIPSALFEMHSEECEVNILEQLQVYSVVGNIQTQLQKLQELGVKDPVFETLFNTLTKFNESRDTNIAELNNFSALFMRFKTSSDAQGKALDSINSICKSLDELSSSLSKLAVTAINRIRPVNKLIDYLTSEEHDLQIPKNLERTPTSAMSSRSGLLPSLSDFQIIKIISNGNYGRVFLGRKKSTGDYYALKAFKKNEVMMHNQLKDVLLEREILSKLNNPFVVKLYFSFESEFHMFLVMEYVSGGDLYSLLSRFGRLEEKWAITYVAEIIQALDYLHSLGIVHRDLKPDNLLIGDDGHIRLTDFGLSKIGLLDVTRQLSELTHSDNTLRFEGTPDYIAPEAILGNSFGPPVDYWSVGVIFYEIIVGTPPFHASSVIQIFENILKGTFSYPEDVEISSSGRDFVEQLLVLDPKFRLGSKKKIAELKEHKLFQDVDWNDLSKLPVFFVPETLQIDIKESTDYFIPRKCEDQDSSASDDSAFDLRLTQSEQDLPHYREGMIPKSTSVANFSYKNVAILRQRPTSSKTRAQAFRDERRKSSLVISLNPVFPTLFKQLERVVYLGPSRANEIVNFLRQCEQDCTQLSWICVDLDIPLGLNTAELGKLIRINAELNSSVPLVFFSTSEDEILKAKDVLQDYAIGRTYFAASYEKYVEILVAFQ